MREISTKFNVQHISFAEVVVVLKNENGQNIASDVWNFDTDSLVKLHYMISKRKEEINQYLEEKSKKEKTDYVPEDWQILQIKFTDTPIIWR